MMINKRVHILISGFVQGVLFRYETSRQARERGVSGWVMNRPDGKVEAVFEGEADAVLGLVAWCRQGPRGAAVDKVVIKEENYKGEFKDFNIKY